MNDLPIQVIDVEFHRFMGRYFQVRHQSSLIYIEGRPYYFRSCMN